MASWLLCCLVFTSKTLVSHSACFHPGVLMGTGELAMNKHPVQGGVEIIPVISGYTSRDLLRPDESLSSYTDFTIYVLHFLIVQVMPWKSKMRIII